MNITGIRLCAVSVLLVSCCATATADVRVYVSSMQNRRILVYRCDSQSGELHPIDETPLEGEPGALTISPDGRYLFAAIRSEGKLASLGIDRETGKLKLINVVPAGADPAQISTDRRGNVLLTAYYAAGKVSVHRIEGDGALSADPLQELTTAEKAHAIVPDATNQFVFVPHTAPNAIFQFRWNAQANRLSPASVPLLRTQAGTGPRHLAWHPKQPIAYVSNEQGSSVTAYRLNPADGLLTPGATRSTIPASFSGSNSCAEIKVHPTGKFLYVSNRGHDSLAVLRINDTGDELTSVAIEPTEQTPRSFDVEPEGRFLISVGEGSGQLAVHRIDGETGRLAVIHRQAVGPRPWWVLITPAPAAVKAGRQ